MASDRLAELLRSTSALTEEEIDRMTESEAWELIHAGASDPGSAADEVPGGDEGLRPST